MGTYPDPVYSEYFADPFVWRAGDFFYAIGTGRGEADGTPGSKVFPVLRSQDLIHWKPLEHALLPPDRSLGVNFWAPEIVEHEGVFFLYYSVGFGDKNHQLRVARSENPEGPYHDLGHPLLPLERCSFAIDAHAFHDDDGRWYLFYARDFLDCSENHRAGTALMVAGMNSMTSLENEGVTVLRARNDWQRFQANRLMYGAAWDWHTLEGPSVRKRNGRYYCFYSGGRWEDDTYGVDYGIADHVLGPYSDEGNESGPRVLRTIPGRIVGPGHNSIVTGPEGEDYIVFHAWDSGMTARRMFVERLVWTADGPRCEAFAR